MHESPIITIGGIDFDLSIIIMLIITCSVVFIVAKLATRNLSVDNPGKLQNFMEWGAEFIRDMITSTMDWKKGKIFMSLGMTIILFVLVANVLGLPFSIVTSHTKTAYVFGYEVAATSAESLAEYAQSGAKPEVVWYKSPTADPNVTLGLAFLVFLIVHYQGMRHNTKAYFKHYVQPFPLFLPLNIIEQVTKLLTHGMRLFGNVFAKEILMGVLVSAGWLAIPGIILWQGFGLFISGIQAFIFTILTMVYLSQALESHEPEEAS